MIEFVAGKYVEHKYLVLIPVHIVVQLARLCRALKWSSAGGTSGEPE
jgi:hypothetical protein